MSNDDQKGRMDRWKGVECPHCSSALSIVVMIPQSFYEPAKLGVFESSQKMKEKAPFKPENITRTTEGEFAPDA